MVDAAHMLARRVLRHSKQPRRNLQRRPLTRHPAPPPLTRHLQGLKVKLVHNGGQLDNHRERPRGLHGAAGSNGRQGSAGLNKRAASRRLQADTPRTGTAAAANALPACCSLLCRAVKLTCSPVYLHCCACNADGGALVPR